MDPKRLFIIDGCGALLSALLLGVVLVELDNIFGIPRHMLYFLAVLPCTFAIYDFYCFFKVKENISTFLKGIAYTNFAYCSISLGMAFYHYRKITSFGWAYILLEIVIVLALAVYELKIAKSSSKPIDYPA